MARGRADRHDLTEARDNGHRASPPAHALKVRNIQTDLVAVPDPAGVSEFARKQKGPPRLIATVNRRVDILEYELAHKRISVDAYAEGRLAQALFERAGLSGGSTWNASSRVDAELAKEMAIIRKIGDARLITRMLKELRDTLGRTDAELIRQVLGENRNYGQVTQILGLKLAAAEEGAAADFVPYGKGGRRSRDEKRVRLITYIAQRFRDALEILAREARRR